DSIAPFDATPPNLTLTASPSLARAGIVEALTVASTEWLNGTPTVSVSGPCVTTTSITMSPAGQATTYTGSYTVPAGATDCTAIVTAQGSDLWANQASTTTTFQIDRVAPVLTVTAAPSGPVEVGTAVSIVVSVS